ncbi:MAG: DUF475 domain-containing protein [Anaerolineaceae bacterium]|nr:DUF475 domain-containing protein [Anaerolineaceae bacterium]
MTLTVVIIILQLIFLEGVLSIDNAAILGTMVADLSNDIPIPWPKRLKKFGERLHPILGNQQTAALRIGLLGAYVGRGLMLFLATLITQNPWIKLIGALYLAYLAFENLGLKDHSKNQADQHFMKCDVKKCSFWSVVVSVELADLVFSLDNVVTAVAISDQLWVVVLGVAIGMLLIRFAAGVFSKLVKKEQILQKTAFLLILNISIEIILEEFGIFYFADWMKFTISISTIALALIYAHSKFMQKVLHPVILWARHGFYNFKTVMEWIFEPLKDIENVVSKWLVHEKAKKQRATMQTAAQMSHSSHHSIQHKPVRVRSEN